MRKKINLGNNISFKAGETWSFNNSVVENFDKHILSSIPQYKDIQNYIADISEWFLKENSRVYDVGCSTSNTTYAISLKNKNKLNFVCIDISKKMLEVSKKKLNLFKKNNYNFLCSDICKIKKLKKHDLSLCILTLPFLTDEKKISLLKKIYKSLNKNGALIVVDKIYSDFAMSENIFNQVYYDFKLNSFTQKQILDKAKTLRSSMKLKTNKENIDLFKKSGFTKYEIFFKWFNFCGYIIYK